MSCGTCGIQASNTMQGDTGVPAGAPTTERPRCPRCRAFVAGVGATCNNPRCPAKQGPAAAPVPADPRDWTAQPVQAVMYTRRGGTVLLHEGGLADYMTQATAALRRLAGQDYQLQPPQGKTYRYRGFPPRPEYHDPVVISRPDGAPLSMAERRELAGRLGVEMPPDGATALQVPPANLSLLAAGVALQRALDEYPHPLERTLAEAEHTVMYSRVGLNTVTVACLRGDEITQFELAATERGVDVRRDTARFGPTAEEDGSTTASAAFGSLRERIAQDPAGYKEHCPLCGRFRDPQGRHVCPPTVPDAEQLAREFSPHAGRTQETLAAALYILRLTHPEFVAQAGRAFPAFTLAPEHYGHEGKDDRLEVREVRPEEEADEPPLPLHVHNERLLRLLGLDSAAASDGTERTRYFIDRTTALRLWREAQQCVQDPRLQEAARRSANAALAVALLGDRGGGDATRATVGFSPDSTPAHAWRYARYVDHQHGHPVTRMAACRDPFWALQYAIAIDKAPRDDTRAAACGDPHWACDYARLVDRGPREDTRAAVCAATRAGQDDDGELTMRYAAEVDQGFHPATWAAIRDTARGPVYVQNYGRGVGAISDDEALAALQQRWLQQEKGPMTGYLAATDDCFLFTQGAWAGPNRGKRFAYAAVREGALTSVFYLSPDGQEVISARLSLPPEERRAGESSAATFARMREIFQDRGRGNAAYCPRCGGPLVAGSCPRCASGGEDAGGPA